MRTRCQSPVELALAHGSRSPTRHDFESKKPLIPAIRGLMFATGECAKRKAGPGSEGISIGRATGT